MIDLLYKGKWIILLFLVLGLAAAFGYGYTRTPEFATSAMVMLDNAGQESERSRDQREQLIRITNHWGRSISNEITLLDNSQELPRAVADRLLNMEDPADRRSARSLITSSTGDTLDRRRIVERIRRQVEFSEQGPSVIQISAVSGSGDQAALLANLFAGEYIEMTRRVSRASLSATREFLKEQLAEREKELHQIEQQIDRYLSSRSTASIQAEATELSQQVATLRTRRDELETELERRQATVEALQERLEQIRPELVDQVTSTVGQDLARAHERLAELKATKQEALVNDPDLSEEAPVLDRLNGQIQELQAKIERLAQEYVSQAMVGGESSGGSSESSSGLSEIAQIRQNIANQQVAISGIRAEISALDESISQYRAELKTIPGQSITIGQLRRQRDRVNQMYEQLLQQMQETRMREQAELGYASLIAEAEVPNAPISSRARNLFLGGFFGLAIGLVVAVLRYKFDNRLYQPDVLEKRGVTSVIPNMDKLLAEDYEVRDSGDDGDPRRASALVTYHAPDSAVSEAYRQLRTNLQVGVGDRMTETMLVTSPGIGEGKTTTACNLAVAFARSGTRTLLIDADMRRPQVHNFLGLSLEPGLFQLLKQDGREFYSPNLETGIENLFTLTAGEASGASGAELITSPRMAQLVEALNDRFQVVIFDTPPALATTEAKALTSLLDSILLVARAGKTKEKELDRAIQELGQAGGAELRGLVLNRFDLSMAYNYWYRYGDYSTFGPYAEYVEET